VKRLVASLLLLLGIVFFLPLPETGSVMEGLDPSQVRLGIGLFVCIAFLWMTEALPLSITALLVPVLAAVMGLGEIKSSLSSFGNPLIFVDGWRADSVSWGEEDSSMSRRGFLSVPLLSRCG